MLIREPSAFWSGEPKTFLPQLIPIATSLVFYSEIFKPSEGHKPYSSQSEEKFRFAQ